MIYLLAIVLPPIALIARGRGFSAFFNGLLLCVTAGAAWPLCAMWAVLLVWRSQARRATLRARFGLFLIERL